MKYKLSGIAAVLLFATSALAGDANIKPGLWEVSVQTSGCAAMQQQMEAMLTQQGFKMEDKGMSMQVCITPEMAKQPIMPVEQHGKCATNTSPRTGNKVRMTYTCTEPPSRGAGEITFQSDTSYFMTMRTVNNGQSMDTQASGRWVDTDCGDVQPTPPPQ